MTNEQKVTTKQRGFDLEERTLEFGKRIIRLAKGLPKNTVNFELVSQIIRSGTSVGANYREANESLSKKDFAMRIKICRKEAKETHYWLELIVEANPEFKTKVKNLLAESIELVKIFSAILVKSV